MKTIAKYGLYGAVFGLFFYTIIACGMVFGIEYVQEFMHVISTPYHVLHDLDAFVPLQFVLGGIGWLISMVLGTLVFLLGFLAGDVIGIGTILASLTTDDSWMIVLHNGLSFHDVVLEEAITALSQAQHNAVSFMNIFAVFGVIGGILHVIAHTCILPEGDNSC